jgi:hypothetical protein
MAMNQTSTHFEYQKTPLPVILREDWEVHDNYPAQTGILRSHDNFREISAYLVDQSKTANVLEMGRLIQIFARWKQMMRGHEGYEENRLYPYLVAKHEVSVERLESQHEDLGVVEKKVINAWTAGDTDGLHAAFAEHDEVLRAHLIEEEDIIIPALLSFSPDEYSTFG